LNPPGTRQFSTKAATFLSALEKESFQGWLAEVVVELRRRRGFAALCEEAAKKDRKSVV
jgi:hypothetical protein